MVINILLIYVFVVLGVGLINICIWYLLIIIVYSFNNFVKKYFIRKKTIENKERMLYLFVVFDWYNFI